MPAFFEANRPVSDTFPQIDESAAERLIRRGKVGLGRIRWHKGKYLEVDFSFPAGVNIPRFRVYASNATQAVALARDWSARIREHGVLARALTTGQRWVAAECFRILATVSDGEPMALLDVVRDYMKRHPLSGLSRKLSDVCRELVETKRKTGRSDKHVDNLEYTLRRLVESLGDKIITTITTRDLEAELERHPDWAPRTMHGAVQRWKIMFNFALKRGCIVENPANRLELPTIIFEEPTIFTVEEVRRLMAATLFADRHPLLPACRAYLAIGMFAGLRPDEIGRLEWRHVCLATRTIRVKAANAKDRDRRIVEIQPNLAAWLAPIAKSRGLVLDHRLEHLRATARSVLGLTEWPQDVMRHTFASYHFGQYRNEAETKHQMGHRDDGRIFYNHYCVPVSRPDAALFWATFPPIDLLPCADRWWSETHPPARMAVAAHGAPGGARRTHGTGRPAQEAFVR